MNLTIANLRAAREYLRINQSEVAKITGLDVNTISKVELEKTSPTNATLSKLKAFYEERDIVFLENGVKYEPLKVTIFNSFMDVLSDAGSSLKRGQEILFHCADERRNSDEVTKKFIEFREKGIQLRMTIEEGNTFITGQPEDYRWIDSGLFANSQVEVIFSNRHYSHFQDNGRDYFVMTRSRENARVKKKQFEYHWRNGKNVQAP